MERIVYGGVKPEPAASGLFSAQTSEVWLVPALDLYDGVNYRALYKAKQGGYWPVTLQVLILSAKHALLVPQPLIDYDDQRMTREQAVSLQQKAGAELDAILTQQHLMRYVSILGSCIRPRL